MLRIKRNGGLKRDFEVDDVMTKGRKRSFETSQVLFFFFFLCNSREGALLGAGTGKERAASLCCFAQGFYCASCARAFTHSRSRSVRVARFAPRARANGSLARVDSIPVEAAETNCLSAVALLLLQIKVIADT